MTAASTMKFNLKRLKDAEAWVERATAQGDDEALERAKGKVSYVQSKIAYHKPRHEAVKAKSRARYSAEKKRQAVRKEKLEA